MRWFRGLVAAIIVVLLCLSIDAYTVVSTLGGMTGYVSWPYNEAWWGLAVCVPVAALTFWYFSRSRRL